MTTDYTSLFNALAETIQKNTSLEIAVCEVTPSVPDVAAERKQYVLESMELNWGTRLDVIASLPDKVHIRWQDDTTKARSCSGEICMTNPIDALLGAPFDNAIADEFPDALDKSIFDDHPITGDGCLTLMSITENRDDIRLYYLNRNKIIPLALSVEQYIEWLPLTKGYVHWPLLFCAKNYLKEGKAALPHLLQMQDDLKQLFPNEDYAALQQQLSTLQDS